MENGTEPRKRIKKTCIDDEEEEWCYLNWSSPPSISHSLPLSLSLSPGNEQDENEGKASQCQGSRKEKEEANVLPPEMLMEILKFVDTRSLLTCRLVDRGWREIFSVILRTRSNAKMSFEFERGKLFSSASVKRKRRGLKGFLDCMKRSSSCTYTHFAFSVATNWRNRPSDFFKSEDWLNLLKASQTEPEPNQSQRIKIKHLEFKFRNSSCSEWIGNVRDLLYDEIPHLEQLYLNITDSPGIFNVNSTVVVDVLPIASTDSMRNHKLPHLKVLQITSAMILKFPTFLTQLLKAAVGLKKLYVHNSSNSNSNNEIYKYDFLQSVGKFHLVRNFELEIDDKFLESVKTRPDFTRALFNLELEELDLELKLKLSTNTNTNCDSDSGPQIQTRAAATNFISALLEAQKDSVKKWRMSPLESLPALQFPTFKNLTQLQLKEPKSQTQLFFPPGVQSSDIFPAVWDLKLPKNWCGAFPPLESIPVCPNVTSLSVNDVGLTLSCISIVDGLCPNLLHLRIHKDKDKDNSSTRNESSPKLNFLLIGRQIWRLLNRLESLEIDLDVEVNLPAGNPHPLNSCFTGFSIQNCQRLSELLEAKKTLEKWGSGVKIPDQELTAEREFPSLLDMTHLKRLNIGLYARKKLLDVNEFLEDKLNISQEYAVELMSPFQTM